MEINEKTKVNVNLGFLWGIMVLTASFVAYAYATFADKDYVNVKVEPVKDSQAHIMKRVDDIYNFLLNQGRENKDVKTK